MHVFNMHPYVQFPCYATKFTNVSGVHDDKRYKDSSVVWVLIAAIIVFFMVCDHFFYKLVLCISCMFNRKQVLCY